MDEKIFRVRVAPSPTGDPHVGTLRTALFNYLLAQKEKGVFVLRIEDTDKTREVEGAIAKIKESLEWIGAKPDEGYEYGGSFGPYLQSDRLELYQKYAEELITKNHAYYCFCSAERLEKLRAEQAKNHQPPRYDRHCRQLSADEVSKRVQAGEKYVVRLKIPDGEVIGWDDKVKGHVEFKSNELDDQILLKSDGYPTYHLAVVVDDHLMKISLVVRGEEWLSSTPKHLLLYQYFGWTATQFAHLPLILNADRSKLSKRHQNTSVLYYKVEEGYHPAALRHFLMFLGWTPKKVKDYYTLNDLVDEFSLERVGAASAIFDLAKLNSLSHDYLVHESLDAVVEMLTQWLNDPRHVLSSSEKSFLKLFDQEKAAALAMVDIARLRSNCLKELSDQLAIFFNDENLSKLTRADLTLDDKISSAEAVSAIEAVQKGIAGIKAFDFAKDAETRALTLHDYFQKLQPKDLSGRAFLHPTRVAITGMRQSMNMFEYLAAFLVKKDGAAEIIKRLENAIQLLVKNINHE